jgi:hypothetical protein
MVVLAGWGVGKVPRKSAHSTEDGEAMTRFLLALPARMGSRRLPSSASCGEFSVSFLSHLPALRPKQVTPSMVQPFSFGHEAAAGEESPGQTRRHNGKIWSIFGSQIDAPAPARRYSGAR